MPIPFSVWIDGVLATAAFVEDKAVVRRVWLDGEIGISSIVNFSELYEQLFDDLAASEYIDIYSKSPALSREQSVALINFVSAIKDFDETKFDIRNKEDTTALLQSKEWNVVETAAQKFVKLFEEDVS